MDLEKVDRIFQAYVLKQGLVPSLVNQLDSMREAA
jgi:hypothetical protein